MNKQKIAVIFFMLLACLFVSCGNPAGDSGDKDSGKGNDNGNGSNGAEARTGKVTFFNESSYKVVVHQDAFSGSVLLELNAGQSRRIDVRVSDNYGVGSTFSIEYLYRINDAFDTESGEVVASGIDPNVQINFVVEENKTYTKQIPQPQNLEFQQAFVKILNSASLQFELRYLGTVFKQTGNGNIPVAPGKTGVYRLEGIPAAGKIMQNYELASTFANTPIPDFTAVNGIIYSFTYNGSSVVKTGEQTVVFK